MQPVVAVDPTAELRGNTVVLSAAKATEVAGQLELLLKAQQRVRFLVETVRTIGIAGDRKLMGEPAHPMPPIIHRVAISMIPTGRIESSQSRSAANSSAMASATMSGRSVPWSRFERSM